MLRKMILSVLLFATITTVYTASENDPIALTPPSQHWLVLGGTRGVAHALVAALAHNNIPCTVLVREAKKARQYFGANRTVTIVEGDAVADYAALASAGSKATHIFMGQTFPFKVFEQSERAMAEHCIRLATQQNALLIYPGRIYKYGKITPISEDMSATPLRDCKHGMVLKDIEDSLEAATFQKKCRVRIVRHSYPWGKAVGENMVEKNLRGIPKNATLSWWQKRQKFEWIATTQCPIQLSYTPDLADFIIRYAQWSPATWFDTINFAGTTFESMDEFGKAICAYIGEEYESDAHTRMWLELAANTIEPEAARGLDVYYTFETALLLNPAKMERTFPSFKHTDLDTAIADTIQWYQQH